jgi:hypothetical protein
MIVKIFAREPLKGVPEQYAKLVADFTVTNSLCLRKWVIMPLRIAPHLRI